VNSKKDAKENSKKNVNETEQLRSNENGNSRKFKQEQKKPEKKLPVMQKQKQILEKKN